MNEDDDTNDNNDEDEDNNDDDDDESEVATSVSALTVGDLIEAMKTKKKAAAPSQPSSVVRNLSASIAFSEVLLSVDYHPIF